MFESLLKISSVKLFDSHIKLKASIATPISSSNIISKRIVGENIQLVFDNLFSVKTSLEMRQGKLISEFRSKIFEL